MRKPIQIKGISTTSSYEDGECLEMMNVRHEQGVLKPVEVFPTDFTLKQVYSLLYWHKNNSYTHLIGVRGNSVYWIKNPGLITEVESDSLLTVANTTQNPTSISHIGNLINVLDGERLKYIFWQDGAYYAIDMDFDGEQTDTALGPVKVDLKVDGVVDGSTRKTLNFYSDVDVTVGSPYDDKQKLAGGLLLKAKTYDDSKGRLTGFILACTAIELYDGNFILQSNPVLLGQAFDEKTRYTSNNISGHDYSDNPALYYSPGAVAWNNVTSNAEKFYEKITDTIITGTSASDDVLTSYFPNAFCSSYFIKIDGGSTVKKMVCRKSSNALKIKVTKTISEQYRSLIKSVSVFISPQVLAQDYETLEYKGYFDYNGVSANRSENYFAKPKSNADILKELAANQLLYKVKEIAFDDIVEGDWIDLTEDLKGKLGDNLLAQQDLITPSFSNIKARNQTTYNSMLHAWDIKNIIGRGWPVNYFYANQGVGQFPATEEPNAVENGCSMVKIKTDTGISTVVRKYSGTSLLSKSFGMLSYPDKRATEITLYKEVGHKVSHECEINNIISVGNQPVSGNVVVTAQHNVNVPVEVSIMFIYQDGEDEQAAVENRPIPQGTNTLTFPYSEVHNFNESLVGIWIDYVFTQNDNINTYFSFRDISNALISGDKHTVSLIDVVIDSAYKKILKLTASDTGNFAYYISPELKPIDFPTETIDPEEVPNESNQQLSYQNKLKVSSTSNPFIFPDAQTYQIGDGSILNVGSQSIRTSDGQFGQYPLICFCTDGIFSLEVGDGTVAYSKQVKPQSYERPISKVICTTPFGIVFISNRGLCLVAGQDVVYLSETMFEKFKNITLELPIAIASSFSFDTGLFNDYLKDCSAMVYNPKEQEVIIINPSKSFNYVYNFSTKQFYKNDEQITNEIDNSLPSLQVWKGSAVKSVTQITSGSRKIAFTTRPIKMQTTDFKRFERVILRGYLSSLNGAVACIWGSIDDRNFKLLRGITLTNGTTRKDLDFGMFGKTTYRSYIIGLSMTVGTDSEIEAIEMEVEKLFNNTNMQ